MKPYELTLRDFLLLAINTGNTDDVGKFLKSPKIENLPESFMAAAEATGNGDIVGLVLDHILENGLDIDHDFPTQLHWALAKGFKIAAIHLAEMITDEDMSTTDSDGLTPHELAMRLHYDGVVELLENQGE